MAFEIEGKLHRLFPTEQKTASFSAREFVLEVADGNYPQLIKFQAVKERCTLLDAFKEGDRLKVSFDLSGREWNGKYFTNLTAWRIEKAGEGGGSDNAAADNNFPSNDPFPNYADAPPATGNMEDLPF